MDDVLDRLRRLPGTPPTAPEPLEGLRRRALRRRNLRRVRGGLAVTLLLAVSVAGLTVVLGDRHPSPVAVEVGDRVTAQTTATTAPSTTTSTTLVPAPRREAAWRIPASISDSFLPNLVGAEAAGDLIVVPGGFDAGVVTAYDAATGTQRWRAEVGTNSVIAVGSGLVIVAPNYGAVTALDRATGRERWRIELPDRASAGRGTVEGSRLYLGASRTSEASVDPPLVYALDTATGRTVWTTTLDRGTGLQDAAPVVAGGLVLVADVPSYPGSAPTSHLHALDAATGAVRWRADLGSNRAVYHEQAPIVAGGTVYAASNSGLLLALEASSGQERWRRQSPGIVTLAGVVDDRVLAVAGPSVVSLDRGDGHEHWQAATIAPGRPARSWVVVAGDTLVVVEPARTFAVDITSGRLRWELHVAAWSARSGAEGTLYLALLDRLMALDVRNGRPAWAGEVELSRSQPPFAAGDMVVVTAADGTLIGFAR